MTWACVQATGETTMPQMLRRWRGGRRAKAPSVGDQEAPTRRRRVVAATNAKAQASFCTGAHVGGGQEPQQRVELRLQIKRDRREVRQATPTQRRREVVLLDQRRLVGEPGHELVFENLVLAPTGMGEDRVGM